MPRPAGPGRAREGARDGTERDGETETVVVDELAAIVANSRKTSKLVSRFAEDYERLGQDRSTMPEFEAIEEARIEAGLQELTSAARLLSVAWGSPESHRRLAAITARAGEARPSSSSAPTVLRHRAD